MYSQRPAVENDLEPRLLNQLLDARAIILELDDRPRTRRPLPELDDDRSND